MRFLSNSCVHYYQFFILGVLLSGSVFGNDSDVTIAADRIEVEKSKHTMTIFQQDKVLFVYRIALGRQPKGQKNCMGDKRTPEGVYSIIEHKKESNYYRALRISYPSPTDIARSQSKNCNPGGDIMIHGLQNGYGWVGRAHRSVDWTNGCIAVTNAEMDTLWSAVKDGTVIEIKP